ncbi:MAG: Lrp/AsnC family transcriptional regulator [Clostridia bacterium]|nr:Lrp/AsnC family transcriptional regulator [Clostridia bacterium]MBQ2737651.1 Lrp/AsnC family transcriptional regulator [Clostridia bacterium]MBQ8290102.1 Lrp/AsnC family transcriptional regulator [Clostridia bacterium]
MELCDAKNRKILALLEKCARMSSADIAAVVDLEVSEVDARIAELERAGVIRGYKGVIDWEKLDSTKVSAMIELKVTPKAEYGFEEVAAKIASYNEVETVYLVSGAYDLHVVVTGKTFQEVCNFVSRELAVIESVTSTGTLFVMRRYKELDVNLLGDTDDGRGKIFI